MIDKDLTLDNSLLTEFFGAATSADYRKSLSSFGLDMVTLDAPFTKKGLTIYEKNGHPKGVGKIQHLDWDSHFFGVNSARIESLYFHKDDPEPFETRLKLLEKLLHQADESRHNFLTCRISADDTFLAHALEEKGFRLCDVLNIYIREMGDALSVDGNRREEALQILERCLNGMTWGRIYQDPNIDRSLAQKFYLETSTQILTQECHITIARDEGRGVGLAIGIIDQNISNNIGCRYGILWLIVVDPKHRGKGVGNRLFLQFVKEFSNQTDLLEIGTQVSNRSANRMYLTTDCYPVNQALTFHWWRGGLRLDSSCRRTS